MGVYVNPGDQAFRQLAGPKYVDKTALISLMNARLNGPDNLVCISRARRFGKSYAAKMLAAYYDCSCNSADLFSGKMAAKAEDFKEHLNQYNVICLDISGFISEIKQKHGCFSHLPLMIEEAIRKDLLDLGFQCKKDDTLRDFLIRCVERPGGRKFIFIIDEWDAVIREAKEDPRAQDAYLNLLRGWFKNTNFTPKAVAAAYITGILPIKKDGSQSAISDFKEYSMLEPAEFAPFFGFTETEVREICHRYQLDFDRVRYWYDGYTVGSLHSVYNPFSVMRSAETGKIKSYWKKSSAAETLATYIDMDQHGLQKDLARLIAGEQIVVDTDSFENDVETFSCKDDVLTLLIHLGYLTYEEVSDSYDDSESEALIGLAKIPNEEVRTEFRKMLRKARHEELIALIRKSDLLLQDTIAGNEEAVAKAIQEIHDSSYAPTFYNDEQSLRYVVKMAYLSSVDQYARIEELPTGHGIADVVFIPQKRSALPALIVELKWNKTADGAIKQIIDRDYQSVPAQFSGEIILVGITYDEKTKEHTCRIGKVQKQ